MSDSIPAVEQTRSVVIPGADALPAALPATPTQLGTDAQGARAAVIALEPPRAESAIVEAAAQVELSLGPAGAPHVTDLTWGDFLAALPAAFATHPEHASAPAAQRRSRTTSRRGTQNKAALPRAYMAGRARARGGRSPKAREEISAAPSTPSISRVESREALTGQRTASSRSAGLATADRWLLLGLMLTSSLLAAVLTSALTVRGMQRSTAVPAVRSQPTGSVAVAPLALPARDTTSVVRATPAQDTAVLAAAVHADSAPRHEDATGAAAPPPLESRFSPTPLRTEHTAKYGGARADRHADGHAVSIAEHPRTTPSTSHLSAVSMSMNASAPAAPAAGAPSAVAPSRIAPPSSTPPSAAPAATPAANAQVLEELRAIHAEIDARKRHMDSLTTALDSLKHISRPE